MRKSDAASWRRFFRKAGVNFAFAGESRTLYGQVFVLHPREYLSYEEKEGMKVVPLKEVVEFCLKHELAYEPALEYLDERYHIGYSRREQMMT